MYDSIATISGDESYQCFDVDALVKVALDHDIQKLTVRVSLDPEIQPMVQGAIDRQLARRHGKRTAFVVQQPGDEMLLLCILE